MAEETKQSQKSGDGSTNLQIAGNLQISLALYPIEEIAKQLLNTSFGELPDDTKKQITTNQKTYFSVLSGNLKKIVKQNDELGKIINSPDFAYSSKLAALSASKSSSLALHKNLASLIVQRINHDNEDLKRIVYNEAIATVAKLTIDQLKILTLCFLLRYTRNHTIISLETFNQYLNQHIAPFLDFKNTVSEFEHIQYAGCGNISIGGWSYPETIKQEYFFLFFDLIEEGEVQLLKLSKELQDKVFHYRADDKKYYVPFRRKTLQEFLVKQGVDQPSQQKILQLYESHLKNNTQVKEFIENKTDNGKRIFRILENSPIQNMSLTSVGKAIASSYFEQITGAQLNIDIWIN